MPGLTDATAEATLSYVTGQAQPASQTSIYMGLYNTAPTSDVGTGGTEVSGTGYARVQVAGLLAITGSTSTSSTTFTLSANAPAWLAALSQVSAGVGGGGVTVWSSAGVFIGTIAASGASTSSTTITLTSNAAAVASGSLQFSAFSAPLGSTGNPEPTTLPCSVTNGAVINFAQAGAGGWGTNVPAWGLFTGSSGGNPTVFDYIGNFKWIPWTGSSASPCVMTTDLAADAPANGATIVVTQKYGATLPTLSGGSWSGLLTTAGLSGNTFDISGNNSSTTGGGLFRQVTPQVISANVTASFAAGTIVITSA